MNKKEKPEKQTEKEERTVQAKINAKTFVKMKDLKWTALARLEHAVATGRAEHENTYEQWEKILKGI